MLWKNDGEPNAAGRFAYKIKADASRFVNGVEQIGHAPDRDRIGHVDGDGTGGFVAITET